MSALNQLQEAEAELRALLRQPVADAASEDQILGQIAEMSDAWNTQQLDAVLALAAEPDATPTVEAAQRLAERATLAAARVGKQIAKAGA